MYKASPLACLLAAVLTLPVFASPATLRELQPVQGFYFLQQLSAKDRLADFETAWKAIRDGFYDPAMNGVDWNDVHTRYLPQIQAAKDDKEFYRLLERMAAQLHDAHTRVLSPEQAENFQNHRRVGIGFLFDVIEDQLVVTQVLPESEAARAGVEPGMTVESVDGIPLVERLKETASKVQESSSERATRRIRYAMALRNAPGVTVKLEFERADGSRFVASLTNEPEALTPRLTARLLPSGNAYISFAAFFPPSAQAFKEALRKFHDAPGLIIDLRNNPGGSSDELFSIAGNFFHSKTELATARTRKKNAVPVYAILDKDKKAPAYAGAVVVLVNEQSGSSAELFSAGLQAAGRARVVGARTCGCVVGIHRTVRLKGGGRVLVGEVEWFAPPGRKLEGEGVIPDKLVVLSLSDIREKRDAVLEEGERMLNAMISAGTQKASK